MFNSIKFIIVHNIQKFTYKYKTSIYLKTPDEMSGKTSYSSNKRTQCLIMIK